MRRLCLLILILLMCAAGTPCTALQTDDAVRHHPARTDPELYYLDHFDLSPPLREMRPTLSTDKQGPREINRANARALLPPSQPDVDWLDPLADAARRAAPAPDVLAAQRISFDGIGFGLGSYVPVAVPPDPNGAAGDTQYVQWVNLHLAVFDKSTGALVYGPVPGNALWSGFGGACESYNSGDPVVSYDKPAGRWVLTQFAHGPMGYYQCVAVSTTSDATGSYRRFSYRFSAFNDYPKLGVWSDGYYMSFNMFTDPTGTTFLGARVCAFDRLAMVSDSDVPGPFQCFPLDPAFGALLPADFDGADPEPVPGAPSYYLSMGYNWLYLWRFHVDWATPALSSFAGPEPIAIAPFTPAPWNIPQPGTPQTLDALSDRLMHRLAYQRMASVERLMATHSVDAGGGIAGVRWYEIRDLSTTPAVHQQGTFAPPDGASRWMGSIAMDKAGNILLGYSASSASLYPSIRYTGRLELDPPGVLQSEATLAPGVGSQTASSRWGDYSAMTLDPTDGCTFWYTNEYYKATSGYTWSTRIGAFKFPNCGSVSVTTSAPAPPFFRLAPGATATVDVTVTSLDGFSWPVDLQLEGANADVSATITPNHVSLPPNGSVPATLQVAVSPTAQQGWVAVVVRAVTSPGGHSVGLAPVVVFIVPPRQLSLPSLTVVRGGRTTGPVTLTATGPVSASSTFRIVGVPPGLSVSPTSFGLTAPGFGSATQTLTVTADETVAPGMKSLIVLAFHAPGPPHFGSLPVSVPLSLNVAASGPAAYDPLLQAPLCASPGMGCDSGATLLRGRGNLSGGPEPNAPNTLGGACADGDAGVFHLYESNDRLRVYAVDGGPLAPGKTVRVNATVWSLPNLPTPDALDLYYAADANNPIWMPIATLTPTVVGAQVLEADYVLPAGALQAVRANFRQGGSPGACTAGEYDDHDDLVFAVAGDATAAWDASLAAPACAGAGLSCDSGPTLLNGRALIAGGPELHQPNTIYGSCADGTYGSYHFDESLDRLKVSTLDGSVLGGGRTVKIEATVWAFADMPGDDALDLYFAPDATVPAWTYLTTLVPTAGGVQTLSATYTLPPSSGLQAVRGRFRYAGAPAECGTGEWDDHDDLIFFVQ